VSIPLWLRREVARRAAGRCEYCGLSEAGQEARFHVDHIVPVAKNGPTVPDNLALACVSCSLRKGARSTGNDPLTGRQATLFHPRNDRWSEHFRWQGCRVLGLTGTGRATIALLRMNRATALGIRAEEALRGRHPPPG
jgi:hypothetical protein